MSNGQKPNQLINRDYSWLEFNNRVLYEAKEVKNPLLERLKFLSIVISNLEEFFMIRMAIIKKQDEGQIIEGAGNITLAEQKKEIRERVLILLNECQKLLYTELLPELQKWNVNIITSLDQAEPYAELTSRIFDLDIQPMLTPLSVGSTHPFPTLVTSRLYLAVGLKALENNRLLEKSTLSFVEIPTSVRGRFIRLGEEDTFIPVESIIKLYIDRIYQGYEVTSVNVVRISRDADISLQEDGAGDLLKEIESTIKRMHHRSVVKMEYEKGTPDVILQALIEKNSLQNSDLYEISGLLNLRDLIQLCDQIDLPVLKYEPLAAIYPAVFKKKDIFSVLQKGEQVLFHPYHTYDPVVELVDQASKDPNVLAIKQTLYRTSSDSSIIKALVRPAENGKYVSVIDELKARFDEKRNIEWARKLEDAGAHVTYGVAGLKTHAKALIIIRKESRGIRRYIHLGTGNYNESTAKLYSDFSLFTSDEKIGEDVSSLFNLLTGFSLAEKWNYLTIAPTDLRQRLIKLIQRETENAQNGMKAKITAKMNSLSDIEMIEALYKASQAGVKIQLIVRGICCLVPGVKGLSDNIKVISIVGRYLEHSRVFWFNNAGEEEIYLSSADWMIRNLDRRVEALFPVREEQNKDFIKQMLKLQFEDNANSWELHTDGKYQRIHTAAKRSEEKDSFINAYRSIKKAEEGKEKNNPAEFIPLKNVEEEGN